MKNLANTMARPNEPDFAAWILLSLFGLFLLLNPCNSFGQEEYPAPGNPQREFSEPLAPPPGIVGVALHLTASRVGDPAGMFIRAVHPLGPAAKAGLTHGQEILAVDGMPIQGKTYREVVAMIRGEVGTPVTLRVKTFAETKDITIIRVSETILTEQTPTSQM